MHLIYIVLSNGNRASDLNAITHKQKGDSMIAFDKSNNVECRDAGVPIQQSFLIDTLQDRCCIGNSMAI